MVGATEWRGGTWWANQGIRWALNTTSDSGLGLPLMPSTSAGNDYLLFCVLLQQYIEHQTGTLICLVQLSNNSWSMAIPVRVQSGTWHHIHCNDAPQFTRQLYSEQELSLFLEIVTKSIESETIICKLYFCITILVIQLIFISVRTKTSQCNYQVL